MHDLCQRVWFKYPTGRPSAPIRTWRACPMADTFEAEQRQLGQLWKKARKDGCLAPWQQACVYGLHQAWPEIHGETTYGKAKWISDRVRVQGPGKKHPTTEAISQLIKKMTDDDDWFPGKVYGSLGGRPPHCHK